MEITRYKKRTKSSTSSSSSSSNSFPADIIFSIFTKLPVKSLLRFRLLSKFCSNIITSRSFALVHQPFLRPKPGLLITCPAKLQRAQIFYVADQNGGAATLRLTIPPRFSRYTCQSVNGIVCIDFGISATVCNPSTSEAITLPYLCPKNSPASSSTYFCVNFFGFDPINNEYKVLNSWGIYGKGKTEYRVFTLGSNQWRLLNCGGPPVYAQRESICIAGTIFYRGWYGILVCFHLNTESFRTIHLPSGAPCWIETSSLFQLKGLLGLVDYQFDEGDYCVWVLEDYKKGIWTKHWIVNPSCLKKSISGHDFVVAGSIETGEIMLVLPCLSSPFYVFFYDLKKGDIRRVTITGLPGYDSFDLSSNFVAVTNYVDNILPLR